MSVDAARVLGLSTWALTLVEPDFWCDYTGPLGQLPLIFLLQTPQYFGLQAGELQVECLEAMFQSKW